MNIKHHTKCRICGNGHLTKVVDLGDMHFQGCFRQAGYPSPPNRKMPNLIVRCDSTKEESGCGLIQTKHSVSPEILYRNYWYESGISQTMRSHLASIVNEAVKMTGNDKSASEASVLDIASNDNTLLRNYPKHWSKVGVDPSDIAARQTDEDIEVINECFPTDKISPARRFDIITSIACFYDVNDPHAFVSSIANLLSAGGLWIFEVAYWPTMLKNLAYDSIVNEHTIHYHLAPIENLLRRWNLKLVRAEKTSTNGGSIMCYVAKANTSQYERPEWRQELNQIRLEEFEAKLDEERTYYEFARKVDDQRETLTRLLRSIKKEGKTIHIYGASTKLNTILEYCRIDPSIIEYAAERSVNKFGAQTMTGIKIISEEESRAMKPDYYLVGPYHFKKEILEREKDAIASGVKFIFPLPSVEVYG